MSKKIFTETAAERRSMALFIAVIKKNTTFLPFFYDNCNILDKSWQNVMHFCLFFFSNSEKVLTKYDS